MSFRKLTDLVHSVGLTLGEIAGTLGIDFGLLQNVDAGLQAMPADLIPAIAGVLGVDPTEVMYASSSILNVVSSGSHNPVQDPAVPKTQSPKAATLPAGFVQPAALTRQFTPRDLRGCILWLRSDLGINFVSGQVDVWKDQSGWGNDFQASTSLKRTAYANSGSPYPFLYSPNGGGASGTAFMTRSPPAGRWDGPSPAINGGYTTIVVFTSSADLGYVCTRAGNPQSILDGDTIPGDVIWYDNQTPQFDSAFFTQTAPLGGIAWYTVTHQDGGNYTLYLNGAQVTSASATVNNGVNGGIDSIFGYSGGSPFGGGLYEVMQFNRVLTANELSQVHSYLSSRYGGKPFLPSQLPRLAAWYRADSGITLATGVSQWNDLSGSGDVNKNLIQAVGSKQPSFNVSDAAYNGKPTLSLSSAAIQFLVSGTWGTALTSPYTIFIVGNTDGAVVNQYFSDGGALNQAVVFNNVGATRAALYGGVILSSGLTVTPAPLVIAGVFNAASSSIYVSAKTAVASGNTGVGNSLTGFTIGTTGGGGGAAPLNGRIAEAIVFARALSVAEIGSVMTYCGSRYGITIGA